MNPCVRTELGPLSECTQGNLIAITSEVWALAQDSSQPETHKDQSTSEYSCPGPQAKPVGHSPTHTPRCQPKARVGLTQLRIWPGHPDTSGAHRPSLSLCVSWVLSPHKHLVDGLRDPVSPAQGGRSRSSTELGQLPLHSPVSWYPLGFRISYAVFDVWFCYYLGNF